MKIGIIAPNSLRFCPYTFVYTDVLNKHGINFDVIYPDRHQLGEKYDFSEIIFPWDKSRNSFFQFIQYYCFVKKTFKEMKYDKLVVLTTGQGVLFSNVLRHYSGRYILDIRDYTREDTSWYWKREQKAIRHSGLTIISSEEFKKFLPELEYAMIYNAPQSLETEDIFIKRAKGEPIIIGYVGSIAYTEQCFRLMALVESDDRFRFELYGNDMHGNTIASQIETQNYKHSHYNGPYAPNEKAEVVRKCDILFNAYGNDSPMLRYALSNKLTDAAMYKKVILNSPNTYMDRKLGICSYALDLGRAENLCGLYDWYKSLDSSAVDENLNEMRSEIEYTNKKTIGRISSFLKSICELT